MRRLPVASVAISCALLIGPTAAGATTLHRHSSAAATQAQVLAMKMARALARQSHFEADGDLAQGGVPATRVRFRFQAPGRESVVRFGGLLSRVRVAGKALTQVREVSVGKTVYESIDGKNWSRGPRVKAPAAMDVLALNGASINCCDTSSPHTGTTVRYAGHSVVAGRSALVLDFRTAGRGDLVTTRVNLSATSFLPLSIVATSQPPRAVSRLTLHYGVPFTIAQPR
ncbi:MAG: hypothetical protein NVS2B16_23320 [Chloroflexota bacterium]